jgi:hypothetical protein
MNYGSGSATLVFAIEIVLCWVIWTKKMGKTGVNPRNKVRTHVKVCVGFLSGIFSPDRDDF